MAILHLVRCDTCGTDTPMDATMAVHSITVSQGANGSTFPQAERLFSIPSKIKQVDGRHFCQWACVATYADAKAKAR